MELFFTCGTWWRTAAAAYGNVTIENNFFGRSVYPGGSPATTTASSSAASPTGGTMNN